MNFVSRFAFVAALFGGLLLAGCFPDDPSGPYEGPTKVSFRSVSSGALDGGDPVTAEVQLISENGQFGTPKTIRYAVVDTGSAATTLEASAYDISAVGQEESPEGQFTFPADSSTVPLRVSFNDVQLPAGESRTLTIALLGNDEEGIQTAVNYDTFTISVAAREADVNVSGDLAGFESVEVGETATDTAFVTNSEDATRETEISALEITGDDADAFAIVEPASETCVLAPGETQPVLIEFAPDEPGTYTAMLVFNTTNEPGTTGQSFPLTGSTDDGG
jgi:hypothetical protein